MNFFTRLALTMIIVIEAPLELLKAALTYREMRRRYEQQAKDNMAGMEILTLQEYFDKCKDSLKKCGCEECMEQLKKVEEAEANYKVNFPASGNVEKTVEGEGIEVTCKLCQGLCRPDGQGGYYCPKCEQIK